MLTMYFCFVFWSSYLYKYKSSSTQNWIHSPVWWQLCAPKLWHSVTGLPPCSVLTWERKEKEQSNTIVYMQELSIYVVKLLEIAYAGVGHTCTFVQPLGSDRSLFNVWDLRICVRVCYAYFRLLCLPCA